MIGGATSQQQHHSHWDVAFITNNKWCLQRLIFQHLGAVKDEQGFNCTLNILPTFFFFPFWDDKAVNLLHISVLTQHIHRLPISALQTHFLCQNLRNGCFTSCPPSNRAVFQSLPLDRTSFFVSKATILTLCESQQHLKFMFTCTYTRLSVTFGLSNSVLCLWLFVLPQLHSDVDSGDGNIKYILSGEGAGTIFVIDDKTGNIHATKTLDREEQAQYTLTAQAVDRETNKPLEPPSEFIVKVQDINDNPPEFLHGPYYARVPEMSNVGE